MIRSLFSKIVSTAATLSLGATALPAVAVGLPGQDQIRINEINPNTLWNNEEFIELKGPAGTVLDGMLIGLIDGSTKKIYYTISLQGYQIPASGFFVIGNRAVANVNLVIQDDLTYTGETNPADLVGAFNANLLNLAYPAAGFSTTAPLQPWPSGPLLPWPRTGENLQPVFTTVANYPNGWGYGFLQGGQGNTPDGVMLLTGRKDEDFHDTPTSYRAITSSDGDSILDAIIYGRQADAFLSNILLLPAPSPAPVPTDDVSNFNSIGRSVGSNTPRSITGPDTLSARPPTPGSANTAPSQTLTIQRLSPAHATLSESAGTASFRITRSGGTGAPLVVTLANFDTSELEITSPAATATGPIQVTIPAGASDLTVNLKGVNDSWKDGDQIVYITPAAAGFSSRTANTAFNPNLALFEPFASSLGLKVEDDPADAVPYYINEVHGVASNGFGKTNTVGSTDEFNQFVEIVYPETVPTSPATAQPPPVDLSSLNLTVDGVVKHVFPRGTYLYPNSSLVVFSGGLPDKQGRKIGQLGSSLIQNATSGALSISHTGSVIRLLNGSNETAGWVFQPVQGGSNLKDVLSDPAVLPGFGLRRQLGHAFNVTGAFRTPAAPFALAQPAVGVTPSAPIYTSAGVKQNGAPWGFVPGNISLVFTHIDAPRSQLANPRNAVSELAGPAGAQTAPATLRISLSSPPAIDTVINVSTSNRNNATPVASASDVSLVPPANAPLAPYTAEHTLNVTYTAGSPFIEVPLSVFRNASGDDQLVDFSVIAAGYQSGPVNKIAQQLKVVDTGDITVQIQFEVPDGLGGSQLVDRSKLVETMGANAARLVIKRGAALPDAPINANVYIVANDTKLQTYSSLTPRGAPASRAIVIPAGSGGVNLTLDTLVDADLLNNALEILVIADDSSCVSGLKTTTIDETSAATQLLLTRSRPDNPPGEDPVTLTPSMGNNGGVLTISRPAGADASAALQVLVQVRLDDATQTTIQPGDGFAPANPLLGLRLLPQSPIPASPLTGIPGILATINPGATSTTVVLDPLAVSNDIDLFVIALDGASPMHGHESCPVTADEPLVLSLTRSTITEKMGLNASTLTITRTVAGPAQEIYLQTRVTGSGAGNTGASLPGHAAFRLNPAAPVPGATGINGFTVNLPAGLGPFTVTVDALVNPDTEDNILEIYAISKLRTQGLNGSINLTVQENTPANTLTLTRSRHDGTFETVDAMGVPSGLVLTPSMANNGALLRIARGAGAPTTALPLNVAVRSGPTGSASSAIGLRLLETDPVPGLTGIPGLPVTIPDGASFVDVVIDPLLVAADAQLYVTAQSLTNPIVGCMNSPVTADQPLTLALTRSTITEKMGRNASTLTITRSDAGPAQEIYLQTRTIDTGARLPGHAAFRPNPSFAGPGAAGITGLTVNLPAGAAPFTVTVDALVNPDTEINTLEVYAISKSRAQGLNGSINLTVQENTPANTLTLTRSRHDGTFETVDAMGVPSGLVLTPSMANNGALLRIARGAGAPTTALPLNVAVRSGPTGSASSAIGLRLLETDPVPGLTGIPGLPVTIPDGASFVDVVIDPLLVAADAQLYVTAQSLTNPIVGCMDSPVTADQPLTLALTRSTITEKMGLNASILTITRTDAGPAQEIYLQTRTIDTGARLPGHAAFRSGTSASTPGASGITGLTVNLPAGSAPVSVTVDALVNPDVADNTVEVHAISKARTDGLQGSAILTVLEDTAANTLVLTRGRPDTGVPVGGPLAITPAMGNNAAFLRIRRPLGSGNGAPLALNVAVRDRTTGGTPSIPVLHLRPLETTAVPGLPVLLTTIPPGQDTVDIVLDALSLSDNALLYVTAQDLASPLIGCLESPVTADQPLVLTLSRSSINENMFLHAATLTVARSGTAGPQSLYIQTRHPGTGARFPGAVLLRPNPDAPVPGVSGINGLSVTIPDGSSSITLVVDAATDADALSNALTVYAISQGLTDGLCGKADLTVEESVPANSFVLELLNGTKDVVESAGQRAVGLKVTRPPGSTGAIPFKVEVQNPFTGALDPTEISPSSGPAATGVISNGDPSATVYFDALNDTAPDGLQAINLLALSDAWPNSGGFSAPISMAVHDAGAIPLGPFINEFDPDTDTQEFIELYAPGAPNASLDGLKLVIYDSTGAPTLPIIPLDGKTTDANGYFTIADPGVYPGAPAAPGFEPMAISLPAGPAAIALYRAVAPAGSALTDGMAFILDSVVYGTTGNTAAPSLVSSLTFAPAQSPVDTGVADSPLSMRRPGPAATANTAATIRLFNHTPGVPTSGYSNLDSGLVHWLGAFGLSDGPGGDSDADGFANFQEYAYGFNPTVVNLIGQTGILTGGPPFTFAVPVGAPAADDPHIQMLIQTSGDLSLWVDALTRTAGGPLPFQFTGPNSPVPLFFRSRVTFTP